MSLVYTYIATLSTVDPYIPRNAISLPMLARDVSDGFQALSGGRNVVGQLVQFPAQRSVPNHLLCDGREVAKASFPELFDFLADSQGTSTDVNYFVLPDYIGTAITPATTASIETATGGTVTTPDPSPPPAPAPGEPTPPPPAPPPPKEYPIYGDVDSGGRFRRGSGTEVVP